MAEYPQSIKIYANITAGWTDITADVYTPDKITGYWGMRDNRELTRVADVGRMSFTLNNDAGLYAPNLGTALSGWGKGTQIKLVIRYRDRDHIKFFGTVDSLRITGGALGVRRVYVTVKDWMDFAAKYPLVNPGYQTNKRADEALTTIIAGMPIQPQDTTFGTGVETFPTVFDAVTTKTRAQSEFNKLALSEMGYIYIRKDFASGENVTFEPRSQRKGTDSPTTYSVPSANDGFLLKEDGDYLLTEAGDKIIIERAEDLTLDIDNNMQDVGVEYGANIINRVSNLAYPRRIDTSDAVLFSIGFPLTIGAGETIPFRAGYFTSDSGVIVNAKDGTMITPVSGTDYVMNTASDGSGTNTTSSLVITADYGTEGVTYTLTNNYSQTCYITTLQARGRGVYSYAALESTQEDQDSIDAYGYHSETLHQMYQQSTQLGKSEAAKILSYNRLPRTVLNSVSLNANKSADFMYGFLVYDGGDLVPVVEDISGIDSKYYIQQVSFSIDAALEGSGVIDYTWIVKEQMSVSTGNLSMITLEFSANGNHAVNWGVLGSLNNLRSQSISFWANFTAAVSGTVRLLSAGADGSNKWTVEFITDSPTLEFYYDQYGGRWGNQGITKNLNTWYHFVITKETNSTADNAVLYVNGASVTSTEFNAPVAVLDETGFVFRMGGAYYGTPDGYVKDAAPALLKDARIYNSILSPADVLGIYNEGAGGTGYLDGIRFQGPFVKTSELSYFTNHTMVSTDRVIDNVYGDSGYPEKHAPTDYPITDIP